MLVLSRKPGERIVIPDLGVVLTVVRADSGRVQLGIEAPPEVQVHRQEVWQRLQQFQSPAAAEEDRAAVPAERP